MEFEERFGTLDPTVWTGSYLPAWSSREAAAATYAVGEGGLVLSIPDNQGLWCADLHPSPLRVSAIHSANRSGPVGSTHAPQPFVDGQTVREEQPTLLGFAPRYGTITVTATARLTPRSMFSAWMVGLEDAPERCGELCLVEVFGRTSLGTQVDVGQGVHKFRDPALREDFQAAPMELDVTRPHAYQVDWRPGQVVFRIDGEETRVSDQSPDYPMMLILGLFDFPDGGEQPAAPEFRVTAVTGNDLGPGSLVRGN